MEATSFGYRTVWRERRYFLYLAAVPCLVQFICHMAVAALGWRSEFMRQAIVMLPAYFAYGWMLAHVSRLVFLGERWPYRGEAPEIPARQVLTGMLAFAVAEYLVSGLLDVLYQLAVVAPELRAAPPLAANVLAAAAVFGVFWLFRYFWFYIPASIGFPLPEFSRSMRGYATSVYMLAAWLAATVPGMLLYFFVMSALVPFDPRTGLPLTAGGEFLVGIAGSFVDTAVAVISTVIMAHAIRGMIEAARKNH